MPEEAFFWSGAFNDLCPVDQLVVSQLVVNGRGVGGTVGDLLKRLKRTRCVALLRETATNRIVGTAAWKRPAASYRRIKFNAAGAPIFGFETAPELGYVVIAPDMQGKRLSGSLVDAIVQKITEPTFATTDSNTMRNNLKRSGFTRVGKDWQGDKGMLSLWIITPG